MFVIWFVICAAVCIAACVLYVFAEAKSYMDTSPRTEMFVCDRHGAFPQAAAMRIKVDGFQVEYETGEPVTDSFPYCPRCYEDRIVEARRKQPSL